MTFQCIESRTRCPQCPVVKEFAHDLVMHIEEGHGLGQEEEGGPKVDCPACGQGQPFLAAGDHYKSCIDELYQSFDARQQKKKVLCPTCGKALEKNRYVQHKFNIPTLKIGQLINL